MKEILCGLATRKDLFTFDAFPLPEKQGGEANCLYRVSEDEDHGYALYVNVSHPGKSTAPHDHTTWAVVVGVRGEELNRLYERVDDGKTPGKGMLRQVGEFNVRPGMYGTGLEYLHNRIGFDVANGTYKVYPPHRDIRNAPPE